VNGHGASEYERGTSKQPFRVADAGPYDAGPSLPGGVVDPYDIYGRAIVPDELSADMSRYYQVTESEFFDDLSRTLADRLKASGQNTQQTADAIRRLLVDGRNLVLGTSQVWNPIDPWLRDRLGLPEGSTSSDYIDKIVDLTSGFSYQSLATADQQVSALPATEAAQRHSGEGDKEINLKEEALVPKAAVAGVAGLPPEPPNATGSTSAIGRYVHLVLQQLYWASHPQNTLMFENRVVWPGGGGSIRDVGVGTTDSQELARIRFALMTKRGLTKLPDILDVTLGEVYEIKPRADATAGLIQLHRNYLTPLAETGLTRYRAGTSWPVPPVLPVPPGALALFSQVPGLIVYDVVLPPPVPVGGGDFGWLAVAALAVAFVATALSPVPGDEAVVGAALIRAASAL
jgi:hypothetical protein